MLSVLLFSYFPGLITIVVLVIVALFRFLNAAGTKSQDEHYLDEIRKENLKRLLETREERTDLEEFDEEEFWKIIDTVQRRAKDGYTFHLGIFRDVLSQKEPAELIKLDNLYHRLMLENLSHDLTAASTLLFKSTSLEFTFVLMNLSIFRGEVFFKNACHNPNLIIGKSFSHIETRTIEDLISDVYTRKTRRLIPTRPEPAEPFEMPGEPWQEKDLPSRYPELWDAFA